MHFNANEVNLKVTRVKNTSHLINKQNEICAMKIHICFHSCSFIYFNIVTHSFQEAVAKVEDKGRKMIKDGHFASNAIQEVLDELSTLVLSVKQFVNERSQKLEDSLRSQQVICRSR